jgi:ribosomal protein S18 acetylase RimI-like enzyme
MIRILDPMNLDLIYAYYMKKTLSKMTFVLLSQPEFKAIVNQGLIAVDQEKHRINGFILSHIKDGKSYITMLYGESIEVKQALLKFYDSMMIKESIKESWIHFFNPISLAWYPLQDIVHPCYQGVPLSGSDYDLYLKNGYHSHSIQDTYYLDLNDFEMKLEVIEQIEKNKLDGIEIALYDSKKHTKIEEFADEIKASHWKDVILENLRLPNPFPLLVALKNNQVIGFTGPLRVEESKRGFFAGIGVLDTERGKKIGKTLFFSLCQTLKAMGSSYMTLYTGRDNPAKYIYLSAGFKVVQSFSTMKKTYELF